MVSAPPYTDRRLSKATNTGDLSEKVVAEIDEIPEKDMKVEELVCS
jgi:hypothetical protein